jgi:hypothetical protein
MLKKPSVHQIGTPVLTKEHLPQLRPPKIVAKQRQRALNVPHALSSNRSYQSCQSSRKARSHARRRHQQRLDQVLR